MKNKFLYILWISLIVAFVISTINAEWVSALISFVTLILTFVPFIVQRHYRVFIPEGFLVAIAFFIYATLFLGEVGNFYEHFWWWDLILHAGSALGFGLIGFIVLLLLSKLHKISAPPFVLSILAFSFAVMIGGMWEIFEFTMDQIFGLTMQRSGLMDTMWDLIVNAIGALIASISGYLYLIGKKVKIIGNVIRDTIVENLENNR